MIIINMIMIMMMVMNIVTVYIMNLPYLVIIYLIID
jgi:hypothetical protein